jgi:hypothetical protein
MPFKRGSAVSKGAADHSRNKVSWRVTEWVFPSRTNYSNLRRIFEQEKWFDSCTNFEWTEVHCEVSHTIADLVSLR